MAHIHLRNPGNGMHVSDVGLFQESRWQSFILIARELGRKPATPDEARRRLGSA